MGTEGIAALCRKLVPVKASSIGLMLPGVPCIVLDNRAAMKASARWTLGERGIRVPEDVLVMGFDDAPVARFARRSLSSVAQPIDEMAERAVNDILVSLAGRSPPPVTCLDVNLVLRESCGCGYVVASSARAKEATSLGRASDYLRDSRLELLGRVLDAAGSLRRSMPKRRTRRSSSARRT